MTNGFRSVGGAFAQIVPTPKGDAFLYSVDPYVFEAEVTGLPFPIGTVFVGTDNSTVDIRLALNGPEGIDPMSDPVIGQVLSGGIITITSIVPEPSAALLCTACSVGLVLVRNRRRTLVRAGRSD